MSPHPGMSKLVTLWGGPLDGLKIRVHRAAAGIQLKDLSGHDVLYVPQRDRWVQARAELTP